MKVMLVTPYFYPKVGGLENYALSVAEGLQRRGYEVVVVTTNHERRRYVEHRVKGLRVIRLPIMLRLSNTPINPLWRFQLRRIIRQERPDVINAHTPVPYISDMAVRAAGRVPTVVTYHNDLVKSTGLGKYLAKLYYVLYINRTLRKCDHLIATSAFYAQHSPYIAQYRQKTSIMPPGVDLSRFNTNLDRSWLAKRYPGKKIVLFVGNMDKTHAHKGVDVLIKAVAQAKKELPNLQLVAVSHGDGIPGYKALAQELGIAGSVDFTGYVSDKELPKYYAGADLFVLPSTSDAEGFGMVLAEAEACGTPVIGSDIGGIQFALQDKRSGLLVKSGDVPELRLAIVKVLNDPGDMGQKGAVFIAEHFDWQRITKEYGECLEMCSRPLIVQAVSYYPPHQGGMEVAVKEISNQLSQRGYPVLVLTSDVGSYAHEERQRGGLTVKYLKSKEIARTPLIFGLFSEIFRLRKNCIVSITIAIAFLPEVVALACKMRRIPYVVRISLDTPPSGRLGSILLPIYKTTCLRPVLRSAEKVIVGNEDYSQLMQSKYGIRQGRIAILPNTTNFRLVQKSRTITGPAVVQLLFVGRLSVQKNLSMLLDALALYKNKYGSQIRLDIIGEGELDSRLKQEIAEKQLGSMVSMRGSVYGETLQRDFEKADIFVLPSMHENAPIVLSEAMSKALPMVVTDIPGVRNIVRSQHNGILVQNDPALFCQAIHELITDKALYSTLSRGALQDASLYNWDSFIARLIKSYAEVSW
jgi:glycosyltransferase involved in cell wall biosynthesis